MKELFIEMLKSHFINESCTDFIGTDNELIEYYELDLLTTIELIKK